MMPHRYNVLSKLFSSVLIATFIVIPQKSGAVEYQINYDLRSYILKKFKAHDIVFLGTRHRQPPILNFISDLITVLHNAEVTHLGLEIESDQQGKIDQFMDTGAGSNDIRIHHQIDCPEYRNLFKVIRDLDSDKRPAPIALDLPKSKYKEKISRDEWMARSIAGVFESNSNAKMLVLVGNNHVLKKLDWEDHVPNPHRSMREYLSEKRGNLRIFSIGQIVGNSIYDCDFRERFSGYEGVVAVDLDERFAGWKLGIAQSLAIKPADVWELLDGAIVY
jgi:hypothetical protein